MKKVLSGVRSNSPYDVFIPIAALLASLLLLWSCGGVCAQSALTNFAQISSAVAGGALVWGDADRDDDAFSLHAGRPRRGASEALGGLAAASQCE
jgi:hypothetical protein